MHKHLFAFHGMQNLNFICIAWEKVEGCVTSTSHNVKRTLISFSVIFIFSVSGWTVDLEHCSPSVVS